MGKAFMAKLIFGCGYLGLRVARRWRDAGEQVYVATRWPARAAALSAEGFSPFVADVTLPKSLAALPAAETALFAVGHDRASGHSIEEVYVGGFQNVLDALPAATGRVIYISTTGVYGNSAGDWIDEDSPCEPTRPGGKASLAAEEALRRWPLGARGIVLRLAGLYGPGRVPNRAPLLAGEPLAVPTEGFLNLIYVDDAVAAVLAAATLDIEPPRTYLISDGHPAPRGEYYAELARLLGAPAPRFVEPPADDPRAARAAADKRIDNSRMLAELRISLAYPSYREGLAAILAGQNG
jgi:nucleoside-diphosphate-sugar epimerase